MNVSDKSNKTTVREKIVNSRLAAIILNIPPFSWIVYFVSRYLIKQQIVPDGEDYTLVPILHDVVDENKALEVIVRDVVRGLGYAAAFVATYEQGDMLPIRAVFIDPKILSKERLQEMERVVS